MNPDSSYITAIVALLGAAVGGLASFGSTWVGQRYQGRRERIAREIAKREKLYSKFINQATRFMVDSLDHEAGGATAFVSLLALLARIRLRASEQVIQASESLVNNIIETYLGPNLSAEEIRQIMRNPRDKAGFLHVFSAAVRNELQWLARGV